MYRKTVRFADEELKNTLEEYNAYIKDRNEKKRIESIYNKAVYDMGYARDEISYKIIIEDLAKYPATRTLTRKRKSVRKRRRNADLKVFIIPLRNFRLCIVRIISSEPLSS